MFDWFRNLFSRESHEAISMRRYEAAQTDRLNEAHWTNADGGSINDDIGLDGEKLAERCEYEARNNSYVEGVIGTHVTDLVGANFPTLQIVSDGEEDIDEYSEAMERVWRDWWSSPDVNGQLSGTDLLQLWVRSLWVRGEFLFQMVTVEDGSGISLRINNIHPWRLQTPIDHMQDDRLLMGVERDDMGRPLKYHIADAIANEPDSTGSTSFTALDAAGVIHGFKPMEAGQVRGVPWLAPGLQVLADLRDFQTQVLDAQRMAADQAVVLYSDHESAKFLNVNEETEVPRRTMSTLPPGWKAMQLKPEQPSTQYVAYVSERLRELGRLVGMPLMTVMLDSSNHNFSSARFDGQVYQRHNMALQGWLERLVMSRLYRAVEREAQLAELVPKKPKGARTHWTWPKPPHVDPLKEAKAEEVRMLTGTMSLYDACAAHSLDAEKVIADRKRIAKKLEEAELMSAFEMKALIAGRLLKDLGKAGESGSLLNQAIQSATTSESSSRAELEDIVQDVMEIMAQEGLIPRPVQSWN